ncbi:thermonuclease family protein [Kaistia terrae]|uniref:Thermonuclease family protein n=1 Tax=Kaistia terrae TaxID=537017 RepID=A0ABW0Q533_9HYPH|nr:thermonuclease family protein [Kaistia terrae]MCX5580340.1 thermonuclease family protein [Kaistia terrae]
MDGADHLGEPVRTALAALCLVAVIGLAVIVTSQIGGLDGRELAGLMGEPAPEQVSIPAEPEGLPRFSGRETREEKGSGSNEPDSEMPTAASESALPEVSAERVAQAPRNVTGPGMTQAPAINGPIEREAVPKKPPAPPRWRTYAPVVVREAGLLDLGDLTVRLAGLAPLSGDRLCHPAEAGDPAAEVACAKLALTALRRRIRALGVECHVSANDAANPIIAPCRIGTTDLGLWLIEQGWAEAAAKAPEGYEQAEAEARCLRLGIWQQDPAPADCPRN